jgi:hypothetical protein
MRRARPAELELDPGAAPLGAAGPLPGARSSHLVAPQAPPGAPRPFRLRSAAPSATGPVAGASGSGPFEIVELEDVTTFPNRTHGKVFFTQPGAGDFACSATVVNSNGLNLVLSAGHCVHGGGRQGDWARRWTFVPGYRLGERPFGEWVARRLYATGGWVEFANPAVDVGIAIVGGSPEGELQDVVGARGIAFDRPREQLYRSYGYPARPPFDGERAWRCESEFAGNDPRSKLLPGPTALSIGCSMNAGASGGSWVIDDRRVVSLNSYKYDDAPDEIFGPYLGPVAEDLYDAALVHCDGAVASHVGTPAGEVMVGTARADVFDGLGGDDEIRGGGGDDLVCAGGGDDLVDGEGGADSLLGQGGDDELRGGPGRDECDGGRGRDRARGCELVRRLR